MPDQNKNNVKLGILVIAGLFLFIATLYIIGKNENFFGSNYEVRARFRNVSGLMAGNNIRFAGIQVGTVKNIHIIDDTTIEVAMLIDNNMKPYIHNNALASIGNDGLMGNKIINIAPVAERAPLARPDDVLPAQKTVNTDEMLQTLQKTNTNIAYISEGLKNAVDRINKSTALWGILNEPSLAVNMKASLENIRRASYHANAITGDLDAVINDVKNGRGSIGALLRDTVFAHGLGETIDRIRIAGVSANQLVVRLDSTVRNIQQDVNEGPGTAHSLLKDTALVAKLNGSMDNIRKGTDAFNQDMEALKHNFLLRGYFRKLAKQQKKKTGENK